MLRVVLGAFLVAHGAVHLLYLAPRPDDPSFPFVLEESWLLPASVRRRVGLTLMIVTVLLFAGAGLAAWGVPGLASAWKPLVLAAGGASLGLMLAWWHPWLSIGITLSGALVGLTLIWPEWWERITG